MTKMTEKLQVYAVNLAARTERKESIISEFEGRDEFELHIVPAIEHRNGPYGLWQTIMGLKANRPKNTKRIATKTPISTKIIS